MAENIVSVNTLAEFWDVDVRTIQNWADPSKEEYPLPRHNNKRGEYEFLDSIRWMYIRQRRKIQILEASSDDELHKHKITGQLIKNRKEEIELRKDLGEVLDKKETLIVISNLMSVVNNQINSLKYDTLRTLTITDPLSIQKIEEIYEDAKLIISNYDIDKLLTDENAIIDMSDENHD